MKCQNICVAQILYEKHEYIIHLLLPNLGLFSPGFGEVRGIVPQRVVQQAEHLQQAREDKAQRGQSHIPGGDHARVAEEEALRDDGGPHHDCLEDEGVDHHCEQLDEAERQVGVYVHEHQRVVVSNHFQVCE
jgi:hypothetical protein